MLPALKILTEIINHPLIPLIHSLVTLLPVSIWNFVQ